MKRLDGLIALYGLLIAGCFIVSAPATFSLVGLFHNDGTTWGLAATVALLLILEVGAVAAKVATLWLEEGRGILNAAVWVALGVNGISNFIHGRAVGQANALAGAALWMGAIVYALSVPILLAVLLWLLVRRVEALRGMRVDVQDRVRIVLQPVREYAEISRQLVETLQALHPALLPAPQVEYPRPAAAAGPDALEAPGKSACAVCGEPWASNAHRAAAGRYGCKSCGAGPDAALGRA